jgi:putative transposase
LAHRKEEWEKNKKSISLYDQQKDLTKLRSESYVWNDPSLLVLRSSLNRLDHTFKAFFRRIKNGEKPGYPRFKGDGRFNSFSIGRGILEGKKVRFPKIGLIKFRKYREIEGIVMDVKVHRKVDKWYISFVCDLGLAPAKQPVKNAVGVDVGLSSFATCSDGAKCEWKIDNPRFLKKSEENIKEKQRILSKKQKGSKNRKEACRSVARAFERLHNQRKEFARKQASNLFNQYDLVAFENLNIKGMVQSPLAKSINDVAWGEFEKALLSKAECAGKWAIPVDPRGTTIRCSLCGNEVPKALAIRVHRCPCGLTLDRDINAARNILTLGRSVALTSQSPN